MANFMSLTFGSALNSSLRGTHRSAVEWIGVWIVFAGIMHAGGQSAWSSEGLSLALRTLGLPNQLPPAFNVRALQEPDDPESASNGDASKQADPTEKPVRRPTTPTDAKRLADRPSKPKFVRPENQVRPLKYDLTFDDLAFEIKEGEEFRWSMITPEIHEYDGRVITLRGYIRPSFSQRGLKQFVFVRDNQECCFGPGAALFDCVLVKMAEGKETSYTVRPVTIEGEFYLRKYAGPDGNVWAIYRIKEGRVK